MGQVVCTICPVWSVTYCDIHKTCLHTNYILLHTDYLQITCRLPADYRQQNVIYIQVTYKYIHIAYTTYESQTNCICTIPLQMICICNIPYICNIQSTYGHHMQYIINRVGTNSGFCLQPLKMFGSKLEPQGEIDCQCLWQLKGGGFKFGGVPQGWARLEESLGGRLQIGLLQVTIFVQRQRMQCL